MNKMPLDPDIAAIEVVEMDGKVAASTNETMIGRDVSGQEIYKSAIHTDYNNPYVSQPYHSTYLDAKSIDVSVPLTSKRGSKTIGVLINHYDTTVLNKFVANRAGMGESGEVLLVRRDGDNIEFLTHLMYAPDDTRSLTVPMDSAEFGVARLVLERGNGVLITADYRGVDVIAAYQYIPSVYWGLIVKIDTSEAFVALKTLEIVALILSVASAAAVTGGGIIFATAVSRPISRLTDANLRFAGGDLKTRTEITRRDEIGDLAKSFNTMAGGLEKEITGRERREMELRKVSLVVEQSPNMVLITDAQGNIEYVNPKFTLLTGYSSEEVIGKNPRILKSGKTPPEVYKRLWETITSGSKWRGEFCNKKKNGELYQESAFISFIKNAAGDIAHFIAIAEDITERKKSKLRLDTQYAVTYVLAESNKISESSGKILRSICECLGWDLAGMWVCDIQAHVLKCVDIWHTPNRDFPEFKAISMQIELTPGVGLPGRVWTSAKPVWIEDIVDDPNFPRAAIASKEGLHSAFGFPIMSGSDVLGVVEFFSHEIQQPDENLLDMMDAIGKQIGLFLTRKQTEEQLSKVSQAIEQSLSIVMITDTKGNIEYVNPKFTKITGYFANEVIGKNPRILKSGKTPPELYKQLWETITSGSDWRGEFCNKKKNGELYWEYASISPVRNSEGIITNFLAVKEDFTERRQGRESTSWPIMTS
jgi:PAS domain S-box-containing protein